MAKATFTNDYQTHVQTVFRCPLRTLDCEMTDDKGRKIGAVASRSTVDATYFPAHSEKWHTYSRYAPGRYFAASVQQTRNGVSYGASQDRVLFETEAERDAWVEKRFSDILKATAKKFG